VRILRRLRRRATLLAAHVDLWREELARIADGRVSIEGTKQAVRRAQAERKRLLGSHGGKH